MSRTVEKQQRSSVARGRILATAWLVALLLAACGVHQQPPALEAASHTTTPSPATPAPAASLSADQAATLGSLVRLDDYPLYTMHYYGPYELAGSDSRGIAKTMPPRPAPAWGCSLFAALGDREGMLYGRNFDWEFSPALLLFTEPPDGYASVSMVDMAYLGFAGEGAAAADRLPLAGRLGLLSAPLIPFDGMNEHGLAVGMAAVPPGDVPPDPQKQTIGSLGIIREMLDHARTVDEALALVESYSVEMERGVPIHYLVADRTGRALLLEFYDGALRVLANETPWHQATNFLRASVSGDAQGRCERYDQLARRLSEADGRLAMPEAMELLSTVSRENTQWSVVYGLQTGEVQVVMGRAYGRQHSQQLKMAPAPPAGGQGSPDQPPLPAGGEVARRLLTYDELMHGMEALAPVEEAALARPADAAPAAHTFEGRLELMGEDTGGTAQVLQGELDPGATHLPPFDFEFVQSGSYLVPVQRGLIITDQAFWNYILEPGRVWQESGDGGTSRASFPFSLVYKGSNATFSGNMTFLFDDKEVSRVWYQVTQEVTSYTRANFWGLLEAAYHAEPVEGAEQIRADFRRELAERLPTQPIEQLAVDYPGIDVSAFGRGLSPEHVTWYGLVVDGVNYVGGCNTRFGRYAYCESMRATSYSTAKSAFVSVALMRLAQKYGAGVAELLIKDYVPEHVAGRGDWGRVTFDNTLDMATGNYASAGYMADEDGPTMAEFFVAQPYAQRIAAAFGWPNGGAPGNQWVYHTSDTFVLSRALQNYLQGREGPTADIFDFVVEEVYRPLRMGPGAFSTMRTADDNWHGQAEGGYGLWWIPDDVAKIATLLNVEHGAVDGVQLLHPDLLAAALQQNPGDRGVDIDRWRKYNNAFWAQSYGPAQGFDCEFWVPHMLGVSGNAIILLPNGTTYYYFSDNREFTWDAAVRETAKIAPHCTPP